MVEPEELASTLLDTFTADKSREFSDQIMFQTLKCGERIGFETPGRWQILRLD